jgi:hypothetical protein
MILEVDGLAGLDPKFLKVGEGLIPHCYRVKEVVY